MRKFAVLFLTLLLCILAIPAMAGDDNEGEEGSTGFLSPGDNIWIAISPIEEHPMNTDRPFAIIPIIPGYPIRVAVYSNPYHYLTTVDGDPDWGEINDTDAPAFEVSWLDNFEPGQITIRLPDAADPTSPADTGAVYKKVHTESDDKWQYVFYVRDLDGLNANVDRLFFVVEDDSGIVYQGSGEVQVTATSQSGGGGDKPTTTGSSGKPDNTGSSNSDKKGGGSGSSGSGRGR